MANVTKPRTPKAAATIELPAAPEVKEPEQNTPPAENLAGTATEAPKEPTADNLPPVTPELSDGKAAETAEGFKKELEVPAPPAPLTPIQQHTLGFKGDLKAALLAFLKCRPVTEASWTEPTKEQIKERRNAIIAERNLDATDMDVQVEIGIEVFNQIAAERAAFTNAAKDVDVVTRAYYAAALNTLSEFRADMVAAYEKVGGQVAQPTAQRKAKTPAEVADDKNSTTTRKVTGTAAEKAAKRVAYVQKMGLPHYDVIDKTIGGYEGSYHALRLHTDGRWEKMTIAVDAKGIPTGEFTLTGEFVSTPIYWLNASGEKPQYSLHQMFGIWDPNHLLERPFTKADGSLATNGYLAMIDLVHSDVEASK